MGPEYRLRLLRGDIKATVPHFYRKHLLIDGEMHDIRVGIKLLGPSGGTLVATPRKACYGAPIMLPVNQDGRILR